MNKIIELNDFEKNLVCGGEREKGESSQKILYQEIFPCEGINITNSPVTECYAVWPVECYTESVMISNAKMFWKFISSKRLWYTVTAAVFLGVLAATLVFVKLVVQEKFISKV